MRLPPVPSIFEGHGRVQIDTVLPLPSTTEPAGLTVELFVQQDDTFQHTSDIHKYCVKYTQRTSRDTNLHMLGPNYAGTLSLQQLRPIFISVHHKYHTVTYIHI